MLACLKSGFVFAVYGHFVAEVVAIKLAHSQQLGIGVQLFLGKLQGVNKRLPFHYRHACQLGESFCGQCAVMPLGFNGRLQSISGDIVQHILGNGEDDTKEDELSLQRTFCNDNFLPVLSGFGTPGFLGVVDDV